MLFAAVHRSRLAHRAIRCAAIIRSLSDAKRLAPEDEEWERRRRPIVVVAPLILRWRRTVAWVICGQRHRLGARHRRRPGIGDSAAQHHLSLIHISEPTRLGMISYA